MSATTLTFSRDELELLHRAVDLLQRQDSVRDNMETAVALDCVFCRLVEALADPAVDAAAKLSRAALIEAAHEGRDLGEDDGL